MKTNLKFIGMLVLFISCCKPTSTERLEDDPNYRPALEVTISDFDPVDQDTKLANSKQSQTRSYLNISDPDTLLAYFLYETYHEFKPFEYQVEYQRLDLEYRNQMSLIKLIFSEDDKLEAVISSLNITRMNFIDTLRSKVYDDYKKYHGVSGMSFDFLLTRNDSIVKPLLYELVQDDEALQSEREYAAKVLMENYKDSSYFKLNR